jgi:hypothetical protein
MDGLKSAKKAEENIREPFRTLLRCKHSSLPAPTAAAYGYSWAKVLQKWTCQQRQQHSHWVAA